MVKVYENLKNNLTNFNSVIFNSNFKKWEEHINENIKERSPSGGNRYEKGIDKKIFNTCKKHYKKFKNTRNSENVMMVTHPFYLHLSHLYKRFSEKKEIKKQAKEYLDTLFYVFDLNNKKNKINIVALETVHHYAYLTSTLLEKGLINDIIFTKYDSGAPLKTSRFDEFKKNRIFFAGGYNERCLSNSIRQAKEIIPYKNV